MRSLVRVFDRGVMAKRRRQLIFYSSVSDEEGGPGELSVPMSCAPLRRGQTGLGSFRAIPATGEQLPVIADGTDMVAADGIVAVRSPEILQEECAFRRGANVFAFLTHKRVRHYPAFAANGRRHLTPPDLRSDKKGIYCENPNQEFTAESRHHPFNQQERRRW